MAGDILSFTTKITLSRPVPCLADGFGIARAGHRRDAGAESVWMQNRSKNASDLTRFAVLSAQDQAQ
ncbi:hypothetical protein [Pelagerythrobacter marensis]|uniref:hypothetical protein n=1 Tax=Pelagerythrobacter marensis TaxID=543877 RepID=UPI00064AB006|nr:hypothetical protein [Pelagerythrobacter marensis]